MAKHQIGYVAMLVFAMILVPLILTFISLLFGVVLASIEGWSVEEVRVYIVHSIYIYGMVRRRGAYVYTCLTHCVSPDLPRHSLLVILPLHLSLTP
jgi:hypothetical protein